MLGGCKGCPPWKALPPKRRSGNCLEKVREKKQISYKNCLTEEPKIILKNVLWDLCCFLAGRCQVLAARLLERLAQQEGEAERGGEGGEEGGGGGG